MFLATLISLGVLIAVLSAIQIWIERLQHVSKQYHRHIFKQVEPTLIELERGISPDPDRIRELSHNPLLRQELYGALLFHRRLDLFPAEFDTWESMVESDLIRWLAHPHELGAVPDELELMAKVPKAPSGDRLFFVYRFRTNPPHWNAEKGWLAAVVGPHKLSATPMPGSDYVFSRFEPYDAFTPEEHVARALELLDRKKRKQR